MEVDSIVILRQVFDTPIKKLRGVLHLCDKECPNPHYQSFYVHKGQDPMLPSSLTHTAFSGIIKVTLCFALSRAAVTANSEFWEQHVLITRLGGNLCMSSIRSEASQDIALMLLLVQVILACWWKWLVARASMTFLLTRIYRTTLTKVLLVMLYPPTSVVLGGITWSHGCRLGMLPSFTTYRKKLTTTWSVHAIAVSIYISASLWLGSD